MELLLPPFQGDDERHHFHRAMQLANGHLLPLTEPNAPSKQRSLAPVGDWFSPGIETLRDMFSVDTVIARGRKFDLNYIEQAWKVTNGEGRSFIKLPTSAIYPPTLYIPQIIAISIVQNFTKHPLALMYVARLAVGLATVLLIALAMDSNHRTAPFMATSLLIPTVQCMMGSLSGDPFFLASSMAFIVLCFPDHDDGCGGRMWLKGALLLVIYSKFAYAPLALLSFRDGRDRPWRRWLTVMIPGIIVLGWLVIAHNLVSISPIVGRTVDPWAQLKGIVDHPMRFIVIIADDIISNGGGYIVRAVGTITQYPLVSVSWPHKVAIFVVLAGAALMSSGGTAARATPRSLAGISSDLGMLGVTAGATMALIETALYLMFTDLGAPFVEGVQGRYLLPLIIMSGVAISLFPAQFAMLTWRRWVAVAYVASLTATLWKMVELYYD